MVFKPSHQSLWAVQELLPLATTISRRIAPYLSLTAFVLSGCQSVSPVPKPDPAINMLLNVAKEVQTMTRQVNELQQASSVTYQEHPVTDERLRSQIKLTDYVGPPKQFLQELAYRIGYKFEVLGNRANHTGGLGAPLVNNLVIVVRARNETVYNLIREVGAQLGSNANVSVSETRRLIRLELL